MSSELTTVKRHYRPKPRPDITIDGKVHKPRARIANNIGVTDRTAVRYNWPTFYVGGIAYCEEEGCLADLAGRARRRNEPVKHPRRRG